MKDRGPWRLWSTFLLIIAGNLYGPIVQCQSYGGARGDAGDTQANLGFDDVVRRHDGYVKGETPTIPQTSFSCSAQPYNPGLYADVETQCQVYHVCFEDRQESFLCGPGTNFNQKILACDFWYNFNCQDSPNFYNANADIGKVPDTIFNQGQSREPLNPRPQPQPQPQPRPRPQTQPQPQPRPQPQQPSYPGFPQQPAQPPSGGSIPDRVRIPSPPPQPFQPQEPIQPQPPRRPQEPIQPQQPRRPQEPIQPQPPRRPQEPIQPQPPRRPQEPIHFQPPSRPQEPIQPQQPRRPQEPVHPQPPRIPQEPIEHQPPVFRPEPPSHLQPPRVYPPAPRPQPPAFRPQPRPDVPQQQYPQVSSGNSQPPKVRPPPAQQLPPTQQEYDNGYQFDGYKPPKPVALPPPPRTPSHTPRPEFPPVVSPPRVARPPLTPPIFRPLEGSRPTVTVTDRRSEFHPDADIKGNTGYRRPEQPRVPQPSRPVGIYPSYPVPQRPVSPRPVSQPPIEKPSRPYQPPQTVQQEHVDYVPPRPKEPSRPTTTYVPPPPPPPPQQPSRPVAQKPVDIDYVRPQPPVSPSIRTEQKKPASPPPSRPQVSVGSRQPPPQRPVFPPASDHPNSNIKGGPGYQQPPPQIPRFEPTRISRPSTPQVVQQPPKPRPVPSTGSNIAVKPSGGKTPSATGQGVYKPPQESRVKKPSEPQRSVYQPPIQVIDHPQRDIKGANYEPPIPQQPQRVQSPSTSISGIKRPQATGGYQQPQVQRPRAPVVVSRPQPPSLPSTSIKKTSPVDSQLYEKPRPQPPAPVGVKQPSTTQIQTVSRPSQPRFPTHDDHPNANVKGGSGYNQPQIQQISRPSGPPSSPSTSYEQKTTSSNQGRHSGSGYPSSPHGNVVSVQQVIQQPDYKPSRSSPPSSIKTATKTHTAVKDTSAYQRPVSGSHHSVLVNKQVKPDYQAGSSYTNGPEIYPKPEFGKPNTPYQPISTPSRHSPASKQGSPSQNQITRTQNKPDYPRTSVSAGGGSGSDNRADYPFQQVPGHQPPHQRQVFPHRENPDHPNESLKGSNAYRPPPPAGFQAAASEVQEQHAVPEPEPSDPKHGDTGSE